MRRDRGRRSATPIRHLLDPLSTFTKDLDLILVRLQVCLSYLLVIYATLVEVECLFQRRRFVVLL